MAQTVAAEGVVAAPPLGLRYFLIAGRETPTASASSCILTALPWALLPFMRYARRMRKMSFIPASPLSAPGANTSFASMGRSRRRGAASLVFMGLAFGCLALFSLTGALFSSLMFSSPSNSNFSFRMVTLKHCAATLSRRAAKCSQSTAGLCEFFVLSCALPEQNMSDSSQYT